MQIRSTLLMLVEKIHMLLTCCINSNWSTRLLVLPKTRIILHLCQWQNEVLVQRVRALSMHLDAKLLAASRTRSPNTPHTRRKKEHLSVKRNFLSATCFEGAPSIFTIHWSALKPFRSRNDILLVLLTLFLLLTSLAKTQTCTQFEHCRDD
jgi:hypothetical protein